nr:MAG TPA: hypothetical protein [Caudoviricetes sp.]DAZ14363.1 MAG TPA: hypothetical protein [Caudoviricetes sp.]
MRTPAPLCRQLARMGDLPYQTIKYIIPYFKKYLNPFKRAL